MMGEGLRVMNESQHVLKGGLDSMTQTQAQAMHTVESRSGACSAADAG